MDMFYDSDSKECAHKAGDLGSIPGLGYPLEKGMATHFSNLPEEVHGQRSLVGYSPWGCKESDMTEQLPQEELRFQVTSNV